MTTTFRTAAIFSLLSLISAQDPCNNECRNGSICVAGEASFGDHPTTAEGPLLFHEETNMDGFHCQCQQGWTGVRCDTVYETCSEEHTCYNGGECIEGLMDSYGNEQLFCDCSNAIDEDGTMFVGKFCEHKAFDFCNDGSFCVNGGECNPAFVEGGSPCVCTDGYSGVHCEYKKGTVPDCDLDCQNGATCHLGMPTSDELSSAHYHFWDTPENQNDFKQCVCPDGFDGPLCEKQKDACGDNHCFHGSTCVEYTDVISGQTTHGCDCTTANTDDASYAGRWCQYEATSYCTKSQSLNENLFCVNGGACNSPASEGCICPPGFSGFSCEFQVEVAATSSPNDQPIPQTSPPEPSTSSPDDQPIQTSPPMTTSPPNPSNPVATIPPEPEQPQDDAKPIQNIQHPASLDDPNYFAACDSTMCQNGGTCRKGAKDYGGLKDMLAKVEHLNSTSTENFDHCVCTDGFTGLFCETVVNVCGEGEHVCLHGSKCVSDDESHACDCATTDVEDSAFAGAHCEHKATQICTIGGESPGKPLSFCVNYGTCKEFVSSNQPHPGCTCMDGWEGPHCEVPVSQGVEVEYPQDDRREDRNRNNSNRTEIFATLLWILCTILLIVVFAFIVSYIRQQRRDKMSTIESMSFMGGSSSNFDSDAPNLAPHRDVVADPFPTRFQSSSSDPFASLAPPSEPTRRVGRSKVAPGSDDGDETAQLTGPLHQVDVC